MRVTFACPNHDQQQENHMSVQTGAAAPDFTLAAHTGTSVSLSSFKGRKTVVAFMPFAFTGG
jgi:peroxiredoxin